MSNRVFRFGLTASRLCGLGVAFAALPSSMATAQVTTGSQSIDPLPLIDFDIPPQALSTALAAFGVQAKQPILFAPALVEDKTSNGVSGAQHIRNALIQMLTGTGLTFRTANGTVLIVKDDRAVVNQPANGGGKVEEMVVTSNKRSQRLQDVPASITAETGATLEHRGATQLEDVIRTTPGLKNSGTGGGNSADLTIRGVTTGGLGLKQSTVALLFDDIPIDPAFLSQSTTNLRIVDIQRVEVLRGPQGTLFGSGSLSGAIRFITNKPSLNNYSAWGEFTGTGTERGSGSAWGNLGLNIPIVQDKLAVRAVGYGFDEGGWVDNIRTHQNNVNGNHTTGGRVEIKSRPVEPLTITVTGAYEDSHDLGAGESLYTQPEGYSSGDQVTDIRKSTDLDVISKIVNLGARYDLPDFSLFSSSTYIRRETLALDDGGYYNDALALAFDAPSLSGGSAPAVTANNQNIFTQEVRASSRGTGPLKWTIGAFYLDADLSGGQMITSPAFLSLTGSGKLSNLQSQGNQTEVAGFGETTYTLAHKLDLTAGLRVSYTTLKATTDSSGVLLTNSLNPTVATNSAIGQNDTTADPRFSAAYRASRDLTLYATIARGHRVGGPNLTAGLGGPSIPASYQSDSLWNYEAGVKTRLFNGRLHFNADVYYIDWSNLQVALEKNNVNYTGNAGSAGIYGSELEVAAKTYSWLDVGGSLSISHGELTQDTPNLVRVTGLVGVKSGDLLPASPEFKLSAYSQVNFSVLKRDAYIRIADSYITSEYTDFNRQGTPFGDYNTVDLRTGVLVGRFEFVAFADNLTNSQGARSASDQTLIGPLVAIPQLAYRIRPRTLGLTLRAHF